MSNANIIQGQTKVPFTKDVTTYNFTNIKADTIGSNIGLAPLQLQGVGLSGAGSAVIGNMAAIETAMLLSNNSQKVADLTNGVCDFTNTPTINGTAIPTSNTLTGFVNTTTDQVIGGNKTFQGTVTINNEIIHNSTTFSTRDGIIEQLKDNSANDLADYGNYATFNNGAGVRFRGVINKAGTDRFTAFNNQTQEPITTLDLGTQDLGTFVVREPIDNDEVATKLYADTKLKLSGGQMTGQLNMNNNRIINVGGPPVSGNEATNRDFVLGQDALKLNKAGDTMTGNLTMGAATKVIQATAPTDNNDITNKLYVDTEITNATGTSTTLITFPDGKVSILSDNQIQTGKANNSIAIGAGAGITNQGEASVAIGLNSAPGSQSLAQGNACVAIGEGAGGAGQGNRAVAIGRFAGNNQSFLSICIGENAGDTCGSRAVAIGDKAGQSAMGVQAVSIGFDSGRTSMGNNSVAIGSKAGNNNQKVRSVAIGNEAGFDLQDIESVAIGHSAGHFNQGTKCVGVGANAGYTAQGNNSVAIGNDAGNTDQSPLSVAIGNFCGFENQGTRAVAIGGNAGSSNQGPDAVAIGFLSGGGLQGANAIAIGQGAGQTSQGTNAIAIGNSAGQSNQHSGSIVLNGTGSALNTDGVDRLFIKPIRADPNIAGNVGALHYNPTTGEITFKPA